MTGIQSILIRIAFLKDDIKGLDARKADIEEAREYVLLEEQIKEVEIRINENKRWLRVLEADPGWGKLTNVAGKYIPKMPTFKSKEEMEYALEHPDVVREEYADVDEQGFMASRAEVHRYHHEQALERMDGNGPFAEQEKCGHNTEES